MGIPFNIAKTYKDLCSWLVGSGNSIVPDIEVQSILNYIDGKISQTGKNKLSKECLDELSLLKQSVYNPRSMCPDVEIMHIIDWMRDRIATYLDATEPLDRIIISELFFKERLSKKELIGMVDWAIWDKDDDTSKEDIEAYIDLLIESGKIKENDGILSL
jgi:hypothetical protein